jgi:hypothetical protein
MGAGAFWIALAAVVIAGGWFRSRREQMKHETIRHIVEKSGQVDEQQLKELLQPPATDWSNHPWARLPEPGGGYRALRILGALVVFAAAGLAAFVGIVFAFAQSDFAPRAGLSIGDLEELLLAFPIAIGFAIFGCGLFYCSRYLPKPQANGRTRNDPG